MREPGTRVVMKVAGTVFVITGYRELKRREHRRAAKVLAIGATVLWSAAAVNNVVQMNRSKR